MGCFRLGRLAFGRRYQGFAKPSKAGHIKTVTPRKITRLWLVEIAQAKAQPVRMAGFFVTVTKPQKNGKPKPRHRHKKARA